ncbi:hypothetical protein NPA31_006260 [Aurantimonas sp. MSK8Z-1]|uniref:hypothetical protein n=1 Tax=Mangrovibrevibacter kandeliae TaxID=2968473 RepID=UPI0021176704|nr:hypothetical protein [Aurantimonas sp. MSK8Z-1]MCW4114563.1 hypothetical protein [Aurantimonas sp. MSK8Z-1]
MPAPGSVARLTELGRVRLSKSFFLRDFLHSEIAQMHGLLNAPDDPKLAIAAGTRLCEDLLEPLQDRFGRIAIRSGYRSPVVNALGCRLQREGRAGYSCSTNAKTHAGHIWDRRDAEGCMGAMVCVVVPAVWDRFQREGDWQRLAWWIHDHLPYSSLQVFPRYFAFNIGWHERPVRRIDSYVTPRGCLTRPGMANHEGSHEDWWRALLQA